VLVLGASFIVPLIAFFVVPRLWRLIRPRRGDESSEQVVSSSDNETGCPPSAAAQP